MHAAPITHYTHRCLPPTSPELGTSGTQTVDVQCKSSLEMLRMSKSTTSRQVCHNTVDALARLENAGTMALMGLMWHSCTSIQMATLYQSMAPAAQMATIW